MHNHSKYGLVSGVFLRARFWAANIIAQRAANLCCAILVEHTFEREREPERETESEENSFSIFECFPFAVLSGSRALFLSLSLSRYLRSDSIYAELVH